MTTDNRNETVTVLSRDMDDWPVVGSETLALQDMPHVRRLGDAAGTVLQQARQILAQTGRPADTANLQRVGLVTGYVQSGKTLSFTHICTLARDNGFPLIIVITGISKNLFQQSSDRLTHDLRLLSRPDRKWLHVPIDTQAALPSPRIADALSDWDDNTLSDSRRQAVLVTVMKNHRHLDYLVRTLQGVGAPLANSSTLVIDDEGDQASLNYLVSRARESTTYRHIGRLRALLPRHTYLQYTATPQAPLLINIIDALSPAYAAVLMPGPGYTGGLTFFSSQQYVRTIPLTEVPTPTQPLSGPPPSYLQAMATFYLGVACGELRDNGQGNRTMMVHPHQTTSLHADYYVWAETLKADWQRLLASTNDDERAPLLGLLDSAHADLSTTCDQSLPPLDELLKELPRAIRRTTIWQVNAASGATPSVPWRDSYSHILIGGQAMDRGFTVEGLTVTYMPRGLGQGNADTVQQRARFFGYKQSYLGFCRIWLEQDVREAFAEYVEHEENMRARLRDWAGRPLREWKRAFFLDSALQPTRRQVLSLGYARGNDGARWVDPSRPHELPDAIQDNNATIDSFVAGLTLTPDPGSPNRTLHQRHKVAHGVSLRSAYELLGALRLADTVDSVQNTALLLQIGAWLELHPDATCSVYLMRPDAPDRKRTRTKDDELGNFYQGANPSSGPAQGSVYPGDREIKHSTDLTLQIHTYDLHPHVDGEDPTTYRDVEIVAVHMPAPMGRDWLVQ